MNDIKEMIKNPPEVVLEPITIVCQDCGKEFFLSPAEQKIYNARGFHLPKRCPECRKAKRSNIIKVICVDCGKEFELDGYQQEYFAKKGQTLPKRCRECRALKKKRSEELEKLNEKTSESVLQE